MYIYVIRLNSTKTATNKILGLVLILVQTSPARMPSRTYDIEYLVLSWDSNSSIHGQMMIICHAKLI